MTITNTRCLACGATMTDTGYLCWRDVDTLRDSLDLIVDAWPFLELAADGYARKGRGEGRVHGSAGDGIPLAAMAAKVAAEHAVMGWVRVMDDERRWIGEAPTVRTVVEGSRSLAVALTALRAAPWSPQALTDLRGAASDVHDAVWPPEGAPIPDRELVEAKIVTLWVPVRWAWEAVKLLRNPAPAHVTIKAWAGQTGRAPVLDVREGRVRIGAVLELADRRPKKGPR
jgi:hypothetical protein